MPRNIKEFNRIRALLLSECDILRKMVHVKGCENTNYCPRHCKCFSRREYPLNISTSIVWQAADTLFEAYHSMSYKASGSITQGSIGEIKLNTVWIDNIMRSLYMHHIDSYKAVIAILNRVQYLLYSVLHWVSGYNIDHVNTAFLEDRNQYKYKVTASIINRQFNNQLKRRK